jgi:hypothetical protein
MSARRRHQVRDRLGRFAPRRGRLTGELMGRLGPRAGRLAGQLERAARHGLVVTAAALRSDLARRLGRLVLVAWALAVAVVLLYQHGDSPAALARPGQVAGVAGGTAAAPATSTARAATATPAGPKAAAPATPAAPAVPKAAATPARPLRPAEVAAAWYAARDHLPAGKVRALQQDVVSRREVRVLVLADRGNGKLDTALVTVRRDAAGRWSVP